MTESIKRRHSASHSQQFGASGVLHAMVPGKPDILQQTCSRCKRSTHINVIGDTPDRDVKIFLNTTEFEVICGQCMGEIEQLVGEAAKEELSRSTKLIPGKHFYMEGHLMVFTELYHVEKGYCCQSGCRHCAYGYESEF